MNFTELDFRALIYIFIALLCSACIAFTMTPLARVLAYKIGAVDVPKDKRRMHSVAMPLLGGVAIAGLVHRLIHAAPFAAALAALANFGSVVSDWVFSRK